MTSSHALWPCTGPSWSCSFASRSALRASAPPPAPKIEPMNAVTAMTSLTVAGGWLTPWRLPVGVDAVGLGLRVGEDLAALVAVGLDDAARCCWVTSASVCGARHERLPAGHQRERVDARDVGHRHPRRAAAELDQQPAVAGGHPAGAEGDVGAGLAVDVRHAVVVVDQAQARAVRSALRASAPTGAKFSGRKSRLMSASVTLPRSGVRPSYSGSWSRRVAVSWAGRRSCRAAGCNGRCRRWPRRRRGAPRGRPQRRGR